jgi:hypothetical protein
VAILLDEQGEISSVREKLRKRKTKSKTWEPEKRKQKRYEMER